MSEWRRVRIGDVAREVTVGFVGTMAAEYVERGVPFLRSLNVRPHRIDLTDVKYVSSEFHERIEKSALRPGDVVTVRTGKPGQTAVVPSWLPDSNCADVVITRVGPRLNARWLSYYINSIVASHISSNTVGAVQQHFNVRAVEQIELLLPSVEEQQAIAEVLGALDDKIAANEVAVSLVDQLGTALVRRSVTAHVPLSSLADVTMGSSPPGESYNEHGVGTPFYQGVRDFGVRSPRRRVWTTDPVRLGKNEDTLVSVRAPVGRTNLAREELCLGRGVAALRSKNDRPMTLFYQVGAVDAAWAAYEKEGTVFGAINRNELEAVILPLVNEVTADALERDLEVLELRLAAALNDSQLLSMTRDELLPLLMSKKIRVKDAEKVVEEVL